LAAVVDFLIPAELFLAVDFVAEAPKFDACLADCAIPISVSAVEARNIPTANSFAEPSCQVVDPGRKDEKNCPAFDIILFLCGIFVVVNV
jgi:hypothetical protein